MQQREIIECLAYGRHGNESYSERVREFAFGLQYHSNRGYEFVRSTFDNHLPHPGTMRAWLSHSDLNIGTGISEQCLEIMRKKVAEKRELGEKLLCSLIFDEMHIRKHIQWCDKTKKLLGYVSYGEIDGSTEVANQAIVFMVNAVNDSFHLPIAYHFIKSLNATKRATLLLKIIDKLEECGVVLTNITFDGYAANGSMCAILGANLDVYSSSLQTYFYTKRNNKVNIFFDICHMEKLIRNTLGRNKVLYDEHENAIEWKYFEKLLEIGSTDGMSLTHKMNASHLQWQRKCMNVKIAVQTLSSSTADSMQDLMDKGVEEFSDASPTINFIRKFDRLFDIYNSRMSVDENVFKMALNENNSAQIFPFLDEMECYIKTLKMKNQHGKLISVCRSKSRTGFKGYIIGIHSLKAIYSGYLLNEQFLHTIPTYNFSQDFLEIFFGKIRSLNGFNDNPTVQQFMAAIRRLLAVSTIMLSQSSNCQLFCTVSNPFSNVLTISSRRALIRQNEPSELSVDEVEHVYERLNELDKLERSKHITENFNDTAIAHLANVIENKIKNTPRLYCSLCKNIFAENSKIQMPSSVQNTRKHHVRVHMKFAKQQTISSNYRCSKKI